MPDDLSNYELDKETLELIIRGLRQTSLKWQGRSMCLKRHRKKVLIGKTKDGKNKYKLHWQCAKCKDWFSNVKDLEVDHIEEVGPYQGNLHEYVKRLFCRQENLQALCVVCHLKKTSNFNASLKYKRK